MSIIERAMNRLHAAGGGPEPVAAPAAQDAARLEAIDLEALGRAGMITPDGGKTQLSEEFRVIKRPIIDNAFDTAEGGGAGIQNGNLVMMTSALPREGKTFAAVNLAMSIASERDHTVLLVDADVAKPRDTGILGLPARAGLMDLLLDKRVRFQDVMIRTNVEKLNVLPAGRPSSQATELLASEDMERLVNEMARRYPDRIIIFDSPPLLATTEAAALASRMGQIVLVVAAGKTTQAAVKEALSRLGKRHVFGLLNRGAGALGENPFGYAAYGSHGNWRE